jgi:uronate dehydrogenase
VRVLLTGAAGSIGRSLLAGLAEQGHEVVGLDLLPEPEGFDGSWHTVDCEDPDAVAEVFAGESLDAVVHLAGRPTESGLVEQLHSHTVATGAVLDAMVEHGVTRIVYASSNHAIGRVPRSQGPVDDTTPPRADTFYGVAKVATESLLRLYADRYGIDAVACRIGTFLPQPEAARHLATWLSPADCRRMVEAALTCPAPGFAVIYGISANTRAWWDLEPGRRLGFEPQDDAEVFAGSLPARVEDEFEASYAGGPFVGEALHRPALDRATDAPD